MRVRHLGGLPGQPYRVTRLGGCLLLRRFDFNRKTDEAGELEARETGDVSFLHVNAEGGVG